MKTYIVYVNGTEVDLIKAGSHNSAEKKAQKKWDNDAGKWGAYKAPSAPTRRWMPDNYAGKWGAYKAHISVAYTEV
jgi:hypothetical protein